MTDTDFAFARDTIVNVDLRELGAVSSVRNNNIRRTQASEKTTKDIKMRWRRKIEREREKKDRYITNER